MDDQKKTKKQLVAELKTLRSRIDRLYEAADAGVVLQSSDGTIIHANEKALEIFGMFPEQINGKTSLDPVWEMVDEGGNPVPGKDHPSMVTLRTGKPVRNAVRGIYGANPEAFRWLLINTEPVFTPGTETPAEVLITFSDITHLKQVESSLLIESEKNRATFINLVEINPDAVIVIDQELKITYVNRASCELFGKPKDELVGIHFGFPVGQGKATEIELFSPDPNPRYGEMRVVDAEWDGKPARLVMIREITARVEAARALRRERDRSQLYLDAAGVILVVLNRKGEIELINRKGCEVLERREEELLHANWFEECVPDEHRETVESIFAEIVNGELESHQKAENLVKTSSGKNRLIAWENRIIRDDDNRILGTLSSGEDITERKKTEEEKAKLQEQYQQAQKVESIGRLAGGVAHDLNNLLSPILGYSEMLKDDDSFDEPRREMMSEIHKAGIKSKELVHRLLAFSRKQTLEYRPIDMNEVIAGFENLMRRTIREDIEINIITSPDLPTVLADSGQLEQVIMNLSVNARDAMPGGGTLTIKTEKVFVDEKFVATHHGAKTGLYVLTSFTDTGCGMDEEIISHLFEPFFSTKGDKGTGLGLATVYGIIKQHGGNVWVNSRKGEGSTFQIYLPVCKKHVSNGSREEKTGSSSTGGETILLVEDDNQVRHLAKTILVRQGYSMLEAENGQQALERADAHHGTIDLLLTDVIMPEMNGKDLYKRLLEFNPGLKVLFMSGYTDDVLGEDGIIETETFFIQKPFSLKSLAEKVRAVLDQ